MLPPPPRSTLFPYTTLFRSSRSRPNRWAGLLPGRLCNPKIECGWKYSESRRSEEHTSELQSRGHLVCRLLLEKKKHTKHPITIALKMTDAYTSSIAATPLLA